MDKIVLDIETQKMFNEISDGTKPWLLKMSVAVTYSYNNDEYKFWTYTNQDELLQYLNGNVVIGFNSINFDSPVLLGENHKLDENGNSSNGKYSWTNYDIFIEIKKRLYRTVNKPIQETFSAMKKNFNIHEKGVYKLDSIAIATLGKGKNGSGGNAVELFRQKKIIELFEYNLQDVRVTKQLYDFLKTYKYIINGNFDIIKF